MSRPLHLPDYFKKEDFNALYKKHGQQKRGVRLLSLHHLQEGMSVKDVSQLLCKSEYTIRDWVKLFKKGGVETLLSIRSGRGRKTKLDEAQETELAQEIDTLSGSLSGGRLRAQNIKDLIEEKFEVKYGLSGIYPLLNRLGYSWITSRSIHPKSNKDLQESFKK